MRLDATHSETTDQKRGTKRRETFVIAFQTITALLRME